MTVASASAFVLVLALAVQTIAGDDSRKIFLRVGEIDMGAATIGTGFPAPLHELASLRMGVAQSSNSPLRQWLVHVRGHFSFALRSKLEALVAPFALGDYVPSNSVLLFAPGPPHPVHTALAKADDVLYVVEYTYAMKVEPSLTKAAPSRLLRGVVSMVAAAEEEKEVLVDLQPEIAHAVFPEGTSACFNHWETALKAVAPRARLLHVSDTRFHLTANTSDLTPALAFAASRAEVRWISARRRVELQMRWAKHVVQDNDQTRLRVFEHGLTGEGQLVAVSDTGLDYDHCFFNDVNERVSTDKTRPNWRHRKVPLYYRTLGDVGDVSSGHGTHVCSIVAGHSNESHLAQYNGMAPDAKLLFFDLVRGSGALNIPNDMQKNFFKIMHDLGSRVSSHSWGADCTGAADDCYDGMALDTDSFVWDNPDFLVIYAAGNYGSGASTITTPGVAKNSLAVGSCLNAAASFAESGDNSGLEVVAPSAAAGWKFFAAMAVFPPRFVASPQATHRVVKASPFNACSALQGDYSNKIVLVIRGVCTFEEKAAHVDATQATLMVVINNEPDTVIMDGSTTFHMPSVMVSQEDGATLSGLVASGLQLKWPVVLESEFNENMLSSFSSRGPTGDGRAKPDLVAPGESIIAGRSDGNLNTHQCHRSNLLTMEGTSMATPLVAGAAALVREYFTRGFYPTGALKPRNSLLPSAALLKATLIAGSVPIKATAPPASNQQGFGRVDLGHVLHFADAPTNLAHDLWVMDASGHSALADQGEHEFCFRASVPLRAFRATLVWTDAPPHPSAARLLVNDLNLQVDAEGVVFLGNHKLPVGSAGVKADTVNNVEQVSIAVDTAPANEFLAKVTVRGTRVPMRTQPYALVVEGHFTVATC